MSSKDMILDSFVQLAAAVQENRAFMREMRPKRRSHRYMRHSQPPSLSPRFATPHHHCLDFTGLAGSASPKVPSNSATPPPHSVSPTDSTPVSPRAWASKRGFSATAIATMVAAATTLPNIDSTSSSSSTAAAAGGANTSSVTSSSTTEKEGGRRGTPSPLLNGMRWDAANKQWIGNYSDVDRFHNFGTIRPVSTVAVAAGGSGGSGGNGACCCFGVGGENESLIAKIANSADMWYDAKEFRWKKKRKRSADRTSGDGGSSKSPCSASAEAAALIISAISASAAAATTTTTTSSSTGTSTVSLASAGENTENNNNNNNNNSDSDSDEEDDVFAGISIDVLPPEADFTRGCFSLSQDKINSFLGAGKRNNEELSNWPEKIDVITQRYNNANIIRRMAIKKILCDITIASERSTANSSSSNNSSNSTVSPPMQAGATHVLPPSLGATPTPPPKPATPHRLVLSVRNAKFAGNFATFPKSSASGSHNKGSKSNSVSNGGTGSKRGSLVLRKFSDGNDDDDDDPFADFSDETDSGNSSGGGNNGKGTKLTIGTEMLKPGPLRKPSSQQQQQRPKGIHISRLSYPGKNNNNNNNNNINNNSYEDDKGDDLVVTLTDSDAENNSSGTLTSQITPRSTVATQPEGLHIRKFVSGSDDDDDDADPFADFSEEEDNNNNNCSSTIITTNTKAKTGIKEGLLQPKGLRPRVFSAGNGNDGDNDDPFADFDDEDDNTNKIGGGNTNANTGVSKGKVDIPGLPNLRSPSNLLIAPGTEAEDKKSLYNNAIRSPEGSRCNSNSNSRSRSGSGHGIRRGSHRFTTIRQDGTIITEGDSDGDDAYDPYEGFDDNVIVGYEDASKNNPSESYDDFIEMDDDTDLVIKDRNGGGEFSDEENDDDISGLDLSNVDQLVIHKNIN